MTVPAKNAPSANDTLNRADARQAMPIALATTARVNRSRDPVRATCHKSRSSTRRPTTRIGAMKAETLRSVCPMLNQSGLLPASGAAELPSTQASGGWRTSTVARSSTTSAHGDPLD